MIPSSTQLQKAAGVLTALLSSYQDLPAEAVEKFGAQIVKELGGKDRTVVGVYSKATDAAVLAALRKSRLPENAFTDPIMISFENDDRIKYLLDGGWKEK